MEGQKVKAKYVLVSGRSFYCNEGHGRTSGCLAFSKD